MKINFTLPPIAGILFDYGATLDTNGMHWSEVLWLGYQEAAIEVSKEAFREAYVYGERALAKQPYIEPHHTFEELLHIKIKIELQYLVEQGTLAAQEAERADVVASWCYNFAKEQVGRAKKILEKLAIVYPLVLVSNFYGNVERVLEEFEIAHLFEAVIESAVVGVRKPDPAIFALGVEALGTAPQQTLVVGDSYTKDIAPALSLGCQAIWIKGIAWEEEQHTHPYTITDIGELTGLLLEQA